MENHQVLDSETTTPPLIILQSWKRQTGEPGKWYERFDLYRSLGPARSIRSAYHLYHKTNCKTQNEETQPFNAPSSWYSTADKYQWQARAEAYDQYEYTKTWADEAQVKEKFKRLRREGIALLLEKATHGLRLKGEETLRKETIAALSQAMKTSIRESREETDGYSSKTKLEVDIILKQLPPELQKLIQSALKPNK